MIAHGIIQNCHTIYVIPIILCTMVLYKITITHCIIQYRYVFTMFSDFVQNHDSPWYCTKPLHYLCYFYNRSIVEYKLNNRDNKNLCILIYSKQGNHYQNSLFFFFFCDEWENLQQNSLLNHREALWFRLPRCWNQSTGSSTGDQQLLLHLKPIWYIKPNK